MTNIAESFKCIIIVMGNEMCRHSYLGLLTKDSCHRITMILIVCAQICEMGVLAALCGVFGGKCG